jgi:hypothetical protein
MIRRPAMHVRRKIIGQGSREIERVLEVSIGD